MPPPEMPTVDLWDGSPAQLVVDAIVVPVFEAEDGVELEAADRATGGELGRARSSGEIRGKPYEMVVLSIVEPGWGARRLIVIGAGRRPDYGLHRVRQLAAAGTLAARRRRLARVGVLLRTNALREPHAGQAAAEGVMLGAFDADRYKTGERESAPLTRGYVLASSGATALRQAIARGALLGDCSNRARELANEPGNLLTPRLFAERAEALAGDVGLHVEILDERAIEAHRMGLLLGVARGSDEPPRVIVLRYDPPGAQGPVLGLVGKGVTFDTGGISIKPADGMDRMKDDMAGGAAVVCAMRAIAQLAAPIRVVGIVPATENMPGGRAYKPGDVLTGAGGKTVEIVNTDAEGRLILGDALWYAQHLGATHLVDVATLTGACVVALGKTTSGLFGTPEPWVDLVRAVGERAGDRLWPMPMFDDYFDHIESDIADMMNSGGRPAGAITAAVFLKQFVRRVPWAHLDVAGTAWAEEARPWQPKGPTGVAVRTLAELAFTDAQAWPVTPQD